MSEEKNYFEMTDEEFKQLETPEDIVVAEQELEATPDERQQQHTTDELDEENGSNSDDEEDAVDAGDFDDDEDFEPESDEDTDSEEETEDGEPDDGVDESGSKSDNELKRILEPFKANGKEVQVRTVDEAITLMQMGANFTKKMQSLKPNLKIIQSLEQNGLLDQDKINFLIDVSKNNPKAIAQLMQQAEIDPLELEKDVEYSPTNYQVSDAHAAYAEALDDISNTPTGNRCLDVIANQWDKSSQSELSEKPHLMHELNSQIADGTYDLVNAEVERVRMLGGLSGMSNLEAYRQVGAMMAQQQAAQPQSGSAQPAQRPVATTTVKRQKAAPRKNRGAAQSPKSKRSPVTRQKTKNVWELSEEEFLKLEGLDL